jgi:transcriptional pleiotropic regulator of transition state genes
VSDAVIGNYRNISEYGPLTGLARHVDALGRVVLPAELRKAVGIRPGDAISFSLWQGTIAIAPMEPRCVLCEGEDELVKRHGKWICTMCLRCDA